MNNQIPCLVDSGTAYNKRDMLRVLHDIDLVEYREVVDGKVCKHGQAYIVEIFDDPVEASIFFNRRIHLNVSSFDYLKIHRQNDGYSVELVMPGRCVLLTPLGDPMENPSTLISEVEERRRNASEWAVVVDSSEEE